MSGDAVPSGVDRNFYFANRTAERNELKTLGVYYSNQPLKPKKTMETKTKRVGQIVHDFTNYEVLLRCPEGYNRPTDMVRVADLMKKMMVHGFIGAIIVIRTRAFSGEYLYFITDGQHRFTAAKNLGIPLNYELREFVNPNDDIPKNVTELIIGLNDNAKTWGNINYLGSGIANGRREYRIFKEYVVTNKVLTFTDMIKLCLWQQAKAKDQFRKGDMFFTHGWERRVDTLLEIKDCFGEKGNKAYLRRAVCNVMHEVGRNNYGTLISSIKKAHKKKVRFETDETSLKNQLLKIYKAHK